jgi:coenzyme PQQ precursor peptide PqqA
MLRASRLRAMMRVLSLAIVRIAASMMTGRMEEFAMDWTTPTICEVAVGMEVTSYLSAEV